MLLLSFVACYGRLNLHFMNIIGPTMISWFRDIGIQRVIGTKDNSTAAACQQSLSFASEILTILGDPGAVSRVDKMFVVKVYCKIETSLRQNLDKFVLITKKSVKFLSSVDHAKCDLLVSKQTKTCLRRQIFKSAVVLPRSTTFCEQQTKIVFLAVNLSVNSVNLKIFSASHFTFCCDFRIVHG